jgi:hypothetical protein
MRDAVPETRSRILFAWLPRRIAGRWRWWVDYIEHAEVMYDDSGYTQGGFWVPTRTELLP